MLLKRITPYFKKFVATPVWTCLGGVRFHHVPQKNYFHLLEIVSAQDWLGCSRKDSLNLTLLQSYEVYSTFQNNPNTFLLNMKIYMILQTGFATIKTCFSYLVFLLRK